MSHTIDSLKELCASKLVTKLCSNTPFFLDPPSTQALETSCEQIWGKLKSELEAKGKDPLLIHYTLHQLESSEQMPFPHVHLFVRLFIKFQQTFTEAGIRHQQLPVSASAYMYLNQVLSQRWEDQSLMRLWNALLEYFADIAGTFDQQAPPTDLAAIRKWINDKNNIQFLDQIKQIELIGDQDFCIFPKEFNKFRQLRVLNVTDCGLQSIPENLFHNCPELKELRLDCCNLQYLPENLLVNCPKLEDFSATHNTIKEIPKGFLHHSSCLETFNVTANHLSAVSEDLFLQCPNLTVVVFNNNAVKDIPEGLFRNNPSLTEISFEQNPLYRIRLPNLQHLENLLLDTTDTLLFWDYPHNEIDAVRVVREESRNYQCHSKFARFYQNLGENFLVTDGLKQEFEQLSPLQKNAIMNQIPFGIDTNHPFENLPIFCDALERVVDYQLQSLTENMTNRFYVKVYELAHRVDNNNNVELSTLEEPVDPLAWGEEHMYYNIPRLIDAIEAVNEEINSSLLKTLDQYTQEKKKRKH